ncbi:hypothetical protein J6590_069420 [Homalodisca vitripennis]|nr:hypothetical protein J6590_069420 [Homalodisca vitripennis]
MFLELVFAVESLTHSRQKGSVPDALLSAAGSAFLRGVIGPRGQAQVGRGWASPAARHGRGMEVAPIVERISTYTCSLAVTPPAPSISGTGSRLLSLLRDYLCHICMPNVKSLSLAAS